LAVSTKQAEERRRNWAVPDESRVTAAVKVSTLGVVMSRRS
jgi:hypothetical protein